MAVVRLGLVVVACGLAPMLIAWLVSRSRSTGSLWQGRAGSLLLWAALSGCVGLLVGAVLVLAGLCQAER